MDQTQEFFTLSELRQWGFFGLHHENVLILPLPRFPGFGVQEKVRIKTGLLRIPSQAHDLAQGIQFAGEVIFCMPVIALQACSLDSCKPKGMP